MTARRTTTPTMALVVAAATLLLGGCGETPQSAGTRHGETAQAWSGPATGFTAPGWKAGEQSAWDEQIKQRNRGQNEYARMVP